MIRDGIDNIAYIPLLLEIFRQGVRLPLQYAEVIKKLIAMIQKMFLQYLDTEGAMKDKLFEYQEVYPLFRSAILVPPPPPPPLLFLFLPSFRC